MLARKKRAGFIKSLSDLGGIIYLMRSDSIELFRPRVS
jgi:hypothetical protein